MSKSAPAVPCSKSHISGTVFKKEIAEMRRRLIVNMFDSNKGVCGSPLTAIFGCV
jgi:hypothetical protein